MVGLYSGPGLNFGTGLFFESGLGGPSGLDIVVTIPNLAPGAPGFTPGWTATRSTLATGISGDPTGGSNAARITEDTTVTNSHFIAPTANLSLIAGANYTFECYIHTGSSGTRNVGLSFSDIAFNNGLFVVFNPSTGAVVANNSFGTENLLASGSAAASGGWWKCWITGNLPGVSTVTLLVALISGTANSYTGDGVSNCLAYGPYLSAGRQVP